MIVIAMELATFREQSLSVEKFDYSPQYAVDALNLAFSMASRLGASLKPGMRVLDLGCGIGGTVKELLRREYDAYGVDIGEWWGKDFDSYWQNAPLPDQSLCARLSVTNEQDYHLPYPDHYFDFAMSSQVFEHVFNYEVVFSELARVLKPGAISVNIFPGRGSPFEPHLAIPITAFAHSPLWVSAWSLVRRRHRKSWREEYAFLRNSMASNNYPSRRKLVAYGRNVGVKISFAERQYIECSDSRPHKLLKKADAVGMGWLISPILEKICQRAMILQKA